MDAAYFKAAIPEPFRILGLRLKPLSLGRYFLLRRFNCAFVAEDEVSADVPDLLLGLVICSMRVDEFIEAAATDGLGKDVRRWGRKICPHAWLGLVPWVGKWWRKNHTSDAREKMALFQRYIVEGSVVPKYFDEGGDQRVSGSHWSHGIEVLLRSELGWTRDEINEAPLTKALADYFQLAENKGLIRLMTDYEIQNHEELGNANAALMDPPSSDSGAASRESAICNLQSAIGEGGDHGA